MLLLPFLTVAQTQETRVRLETNKAFWGMRMLKSDAEDEPFSLPFFEDFEGDVSLWRTENRNNDDAAWGIGTSYPYSGEKHATIGWNSEGNDDWLFSPEISLPANEEIELSFYAASETYAYLETMEVYVHNENSGLTLIKTIENVPSTYTQYTCDLSEYAGQITRVAFVSISIDMYYLDIDDVRIDIKSTEANTSLISIGDGTTEKHLPTNSYYRHSYTQSLYLQSEINTSGLIKAIKYYYNGFAHLSNAIQVYMGHTTKESFEEVSEWVRTNDLTLVYDGLFTMPKVEGWITIHLDQWFEYDNSQNLVIAVLDNAGTSNFNNSGFYSTSTSENRSLESYSDIYPFDMENVLNAVSTLAFIPNTVFLFQKDVSATKPFVTTTAISDIAQTSAKSGGNVTADGGAEVTTRGVCWSTSENPTISDNKTTDGTGTGTFTSSMTGLQANTKYYVRAYATNSEGTAYGEQVEFTTLQAQSSVALQLPFYEDCEGDVSAWNIEDRDADGKKWKTSGTYPHSGVHAFHVGFNSSGNNDWLISPELSFPENQKITLTL